MVKNLPANEGDARDRSSIPGWEDPLEEEMATHSSILAWKIPWTEESGRLQSVGHKESDMTERLTHTHPLSCQTYFLFVFLIFSSFIEL